jgi:hypothetical protein
LLAGDVPAAERELRTSTAAFEEIGATTSATTHRALLAEVVSRLGHQDAEELVRRVAAEAPNHDLIAHVLWRCALARIRARDGAAQEAIELATAARELLREAEFPQLGIAALTAAAEAAVAADDTAEAERLLAEARKIAEAKGAVANFSQLAAVRVTG